MERLTDVRREGWLKVQQVREQLALCKLDPRRTSARNPAQGLKGLQHLDVDRPGNPSASPTR